MCPFVAHLEDQKTVSEGDYIGGCLGGSGGGCRRGIVIAPPSVAVAGCGVAVAGEVGASTPTGPAEKALPNS